MQKIYIGENPHKKTDKHPTHLIKLIPEDDAEDAEWIDLGALWLAKSGNGWSGSFQDYVTITIDEKLMAEKKKPKEQVQANKKYQSKTYNHEQLSNNLHS